MDQEFHCSLVNQKQGSGSHDYRTGFHLTPMQVVDGRVFAIQSDAIRGEG